MTEETGTQEAVASEFSGVDKAIAGAVGVFGVGIADFGLGPIVMALSAWLGWLPAFVLAAVCYTGFSLVCCTWLLRRWDQWELSPSGARLERRLDKLRTNRVLKYPVGWLSHGSLVLFTIASAILGAVFGVAVFRWATGAHLSRGRVLVASIAAGLWFAAFNSGIGAAVGRVLQSI